MMPPNTTPAFPAPIGALLAARGATVLGHGDISTHTELVDDFCCEIGARYVAGHPLLKVLRRAATTKQAITFDLGRVPRPEHEGCLELGRMLWESGAVCGPAPHPKASRLQFEVPAHMRSLICGRWLESVAFRLTRDALGTAARSVTFRHERCGDGELDVVAACGDTLVVIECRLGRLQSKTERFGTVLDALGASAPTHGIMVSTTAPRNLEARLEALHGFTFCAPDRLVATLGELIATRRPEASEVAPDNQAGDAVQSAPSALVREFGAALPATAEALEARMIELCPEHTPAEVACVVRHLAASNLVKRRESSSDDGDVGLTLLSHRAPPSDKDWPSAAERHLRGVVRLCLGYEPGEGWLAALRACDTSTGLRAD